MIISTLLVSYVNLTGQFVRMGSSVISLILSSTVTAKEVIDISLCYKRGGEESRKMVPFHSKHEDVRVSDSCRGCPLLCLGVGGRVQSLKVQ